MRQGNEYLIRLENTPTISVKLGWAIIRGGGNTYPVDLKDLTKSPGMDCSAHVVALANNPYEAGDYSNGPEIALVMNNADPKEPGEAIRITLITAL